MRKAGSSAQQQDLVYELIAAHAAAWARFGHACYLIDDDEAKAEGRHIVAADRAEYDAANSAVETAYHTLLAAPFGDPVALRAKANWIRLHTDCTNSLGHDEVDLLLQSLAATPPRSAS